MAASDSPLPGTPGSGVQAASPAHPGRRNQVIVGVACLVVIVIAAAFAGSTSGWDAIGRGGINRSLLPKVGEPAPDFTTEDVFGNPVSLSQFRGQPVWLMFWGSWCPPCRAEFPDIQAAYAKLEPEGLRMLGVSLRESPVDAAAYAGRNGATFLVLSDPDETDTGAAYPIFNFPTHIFIDSDGIVRSVILEDMDEEQAIAEASRVLAAGPAAQS
ncbi:MAG: TlpA family protein disulfide reductase [Thermomicrobiales bacterium]|nr:TlpA family protein disulfide reductase [Thermomicrobiales bacterium]